MNDRTPTLQAPSPRRRRTPDVNEPRWDIEDVSARADVSQRLVRHCEARGLLAGAARASTSRCRYTHDDIAVLRFVRRTHVLGFGMNETAQLLSLWRGGQGPEHVLRRLVDADADPQHPSCPILDALIEAEQRHRSDAGPLP
nr:MerR family transcriptional regulator [uncultured Achromobacter sp.]